MAKRKQRAKKNVVLLPALLILVLLLLFFFRKPLLRLYYVKEYPELLTRNAEQYGIPESLLCGVIWSESRFDPDAVSSVGACGLMQLMEPTFLELRGRIGLEGAGDIFSPEDNMQCGAFYLRYLYRIYGDWETVLAAYNAGLGNVNEWLSSPEYSDDGKKLKKIPFSETDHYVKKVLGAWNIYQYLYPQEQKEVKNGS